MKPNTTTGALKEYPTDQWVKPELTKLGDNQLHGKNYSTTEDTGPYGSMYAPS